MLGICISKIFSFDKMFRFVSCSYINYMALVSFYQSSQISFSLYLTTFPFVLFNSVGFTPFLFACLQQIVPVAFHGGWEGFLGEDLVPQELTSPFQLKPEFSSSPWSADIHSRKLCPTSWVQKQSKAVTLAFPLQILALLSSGQCGGVLLGQKILAPSNC